MFIVLYFMYQIIDIEIKGCSNLIYLFIYISPILDSNGVCFTDSKSNKKKKNI